jgi:biopolymer transport protein ExbB
MGFHPGRFHQGHWLAGLFASGGKALPLLLLAGFLAVTPLVAGRALAQQAPATDSTAADTPTPAAGTQPMTDAADAMSGGLPIAGATPEGSVSVDGYMLGPDGQLLLGPDGQPLLADPSLLPYDLSPWGMFLQADWVVKAVMIGLAFASVLTWTVWLVTSLELMAARRRARAARLAIAHVGSLAEAVTALQNKEEGAARDLVTATAHEVQISSGLPSEGIKERVASRLERIESAAQRHITRGTGILATIGSTAPFVGLFGTVWGIMNSFIGISKAQTTNLAVVAPGIAEALLATAIGLVAAIPAVVIYNKFSRSISGYRALLADISAELLRLVSRDLDQRRGSYREAAE